MENHTRNDETENGRFWAEKCEIFGSCPWRQSCSILRHDNRPTLCDHSGHRSDHPGRVADFRTPDTGAGAEKRGIMNFRYLVLLAIVLGVFLSLAIAW